MVPDGQNDDENQRTATVIPTTTTNSSLPPRKRLLAGLKGGFPSHPPDSASSVEPDVSRSDLHSNPNHGGGALSFLNVSKCHACGDSGAHRGGAGGSRKLRRLNSGSRVVILCRPCAEAVDCGSACSYCFLKLSDSVTALSCVDCRRLVHRDCGFQMQNSASDFDPRTFLCVDCRVPNSKVNRFERAELGHAAGVGDKTSIDQDNPRQNQEIALSDSCSAKGSKASLFGDSSCPLEEIVKEANLEAKKAVAAATLARKKASRMAASARNAAALAKSALSLVAVATQKGNSPGGVGSLVVGACSSTANTKRKENGGIGDEELALRLHRAINCSPSIWKNNYCNGEQSSLKEDGLYIYRRRGLNCLPNSEKKRNINSVQHLWNNESVNDSGDGSKSESGSHSVCGRFEACTEDKLVENPDRPDTEPSVGPGPLPDVVLTRIDTDREHVGSPKVDNGRWKIGGQSEESGQPVLERLIENGVDDIEGHLSSRNIKYDAQVKEDQASCSNKPANSSGDDNSLDSDFESCRVQHVLSVGDGESTHCERESPKYCNTRCRTRDEPCSSQTQKGRACLSDKSPRKYSRRCLGVKGVANRKTTPLSEDFTIESQASVDAGKLWKPSCCKNSKAFSNASCQSPSVPQQASACPSGVSGCQS